MTADTQQIPDIAATPAWQALQRHHDEIGEKHLRELFAEDPERGTRADTDGRRPLHRLQQAPGHPRDAAAADRPGPHRAPRTAARRDVLRRAHQHLGEPRGAAHRAAAAARRRADRRRPERRRGRARGARQDGRLHRPAAQRRVDGRHRRAHQDRRQHRHRRLGPRPGDGVPGAAPLRRRGHLGAVRLQRRPRRPGGQARRTRPRHNAFHRRVEDVLHAGDADQRDRGAPLADRRARRRRGVQALRRGLDEQEAGRRLRHQHRQHVRLLGLGRRTLFGGLGDRVVGDGGHRPGAVRRLPGRLPPRRRALPHRAAGGQRACAARPHRALVQRVLRRAVACGAAVLQRHVAVRRLSAAADHGVQRQVGARRRLTGHHRAPAKSSGANREPTASTRSTSCCTRARGWCRPTSSGSPSPPTTWPPPTAPAACTTC